MPLTKSPSVFVVFVLALTALVSTGALAQSAGYRIGPKDLVEIRVFEAPEFNASLRVSEAGAINLPVVGEVVVNGLTEDGLTGHIKAVLEECCMQRASVAVQVIEFNSRPISVIGSVSRPGPLSFSGRWTLLEVLTEAGGLSPQHGEVIYVLRRSDNGLSDQIAIRVEDLLGKADQRVNIPIFANDLVNVPATVEVTIFCLGEVERPGALVFKSTERITLLTAVARAGGLSDRASRKITIKREARSGRAATELQVDYKDVLAGRADDLELSQGDVVVVKESFF